MKVEATVDVGKNMTDLLEKLAHQIGTTVDKIYPIYIKQAYIQGITELSLMALGVVISAILLLIGVRMGRKEKWEDGIWIAFMVVGGLAAFATVLIMVLGGPDTIGKIYNPEYYAVHQIIADVSTLK